MKNEENHSRNGFQGSFQVKKEPENESLGSSLQGNRLNERISMIPFGQRRNLLEFDEKPRKEKHFEGKTEGIGHVKQEEEWDHWEFPTKMNMSGVEREPKNEERTQRNSKGALLGQNDKLEFVEKNLLIFQNEQPNQPPSFPSIKKEEESQWSSRGMGENKGRREDTQMVCETIHATVKIEETQNDKGNSAFFGGFDDFDDFGLAHDQNSGLHPLFDQSLVLKSRNTENKSDVSTTDMKLEAPLESNHQELKALDSNRILDDPSSNKGLHRVLEPVYFFSKAKISKNGKNDLKEHSIHPKLTWEEIKKHKTIIEGKSSGKPPGAKMNLEQMKTWTYLQSKELRAYQFSLVETCLFHNTLVGLPTGLGKTFVALNVMNNYYRWFENGQIFFLAPTKPLVYQQFRACAENETFKPLEMMELTGETQASERKKAYQKGRLFFMTPQTLENDIENERLDLDRIVLVIYGTF